MAGRFLVDLIEMSAQKLKSSANAKLRSQLEKVAQEASELRTTLLKVSALERQTEKKISIMERPSAIYLIYLRPFLTTA